MQQHQISIATVPTQGSTDNPQTPSEFNLRLTGPSVLVLALTLAIVIRGRSGRHRPKPPKVGGRVPIAV